MCTKTVMRISAAFISLAICALSTAQSAVEFGKVKEKYLLLPVSKSSPRRQAVLSAPGMEDYTFLIRLAPDEVSTDYWVYCETDIYRGKKLTLSFPVEQGMGLVHLSDTIPGEAEMYREPLRPQQHFTFKRGWNNDPNGLIYHNGEYHLFAQHNPFEAAWQNMHWGHAVSSDLVHWRQLPIALRPDKLGTMYSGSAVIDKNNTAGFGKDGKSAMVAVYTSCGRVNFTPQCQCLAYSLDNGRNWTKYEGNPVLESSTERFGSGTRDPKVFRYEPAGHWVMVLFEGDGHSIYTSPDLKEWTYRSHITGFYECPDFYELPVDGDPGNTKWVMTAASGVYMLGSFDGFSFKSETGMLMYAEGEFYAGQTFSDFPDGRRVQILWEKTSYEDMPFRSSFSTPLEMTLRTTRDGVRLFAEPAREFDILQHSAFSGRNLSGEELTAALTPFGSEGSLRVKCTLSVSRTNTKPTMTIDGQDLVRWDVGRCQINGKFYAPRALDEKKLSFELILDHGIIEAYFDGGAYSQFIGRKASKPGKGFEFSGDAHIDSLEIFTLDSIWE